MAPIPAETAVRYQGDNSTPHEYAFFLLQQKAESCLHWHKTLSLPLINHRDTLLKLSDPQIIYSRGLRLIDLVNLMMLTPQSIWHLNRREYLPWQVGVKASAQEQNLWQLRLTEEQISLTLALGVDAENPSWQGRSPGKLTDAVGKTLLGALLVAEPFQLRSAKTHGLLVGEIKPGQDGNFGLAITSGLLPGKLLNSLELDQSYFPELMYPLPIIWQETEIGRQILPLLSSETLTPASVLVCPRPQSEVNLFGQ